MGQFASVDLYEQKKKQYPNMYNKWTPESFLKDCGKKIKVHDCIALAVKGYMMSSSPYDPAIYTPKWDVSADQMIEMCEVSGDIDSMPDIPGVLVWKKGHIAIYDMNQFEIECEGHATGTVRKKLKEKRWKKWGLCPWWEYISLASWICSLYKNILNRDPDAEGMAYWTQQLNSRNQSPSQVLGFFLASPELEARQLSDTDFVTILYRVFFDREPDPEGLAYWCEQIGKTSRSDVVEDLLYSKEWKDMETYLEYII